MRFGSLIKEFSSKADLVEFNKSKSEREVLLMNNNELKTFVKSDTEAFSVRMLVKGAWGYASTNSEKNIRDVFNKSYKLAVNSSLIKKQPTITKDLEVNNEVVKQKIKTNPFSLSDEDKIKYLNVFNKTYSDKNIKNIDTYTTYTHEVKNYLNSSGASVEQENYYTELFSTIIGGSKLVSADFALRAKKGFELLDDFNYDKKIKELEEKLNRLMNAKLVKPGVYTVIVDSELAGTFFHEAVGHALEADTLREKSTCLCLNEEVSSDVLTLYDDPTLKDYWGSYSYDDEGIRAKPSLLISKGRVVNFINDVSSYFDVPGLQKTSNGRFSSPHSIPIPRMSNIVVKPGNADDKDLLEEAGKGLLVKGFSGGAVEPINGVFTFKAEEAFRINKGELGESFKGVSLSGDLKELLKNIINVGKSVKENWTGGTCNKKNQRVPVSEKVPDILVGGVSVGN